MRSHKRDELMYDNRVPDWVKTHKLYVPEKKPIQKWTIEELRRGLCPKSRGQVEACKVCKGKCRIGSTLLERLKED